MTSAPHWLHHLPASLSATYHPRNMTDATSLPPLDPRKYPWHRGDVVTLGFEKNGFVLDSTPERFEVLWMPSREVERIEPHKIDNLLRLGHAELGTAGGTKTNVQMLDSILALKSIQATLNDRVSAIRTDDERKSLDSLISRVFAQDGCNWDKAHQEQLLTLAVKPSGVGLLFKIQERVHRVLCKKH